MEKMDEKVKKELDMLKEVIVKTLPVEKIFLFGSFAYGTPHKDSDLDIFIVLKEGVEMNELDAAVKVRVEIGDKQMMPLDILVSRHSSYHRRKTHPTIERKITREGVVLYG
jgi:predicted nucleotidyltransferase